MSNSNLGRYHCCESICHNRHAFENSIYSKCLAECGFCKVEGIQTVASLSFLELQTGGGVEVGFTAGDCTLISIFIKGNF